MSLSLGTLPDVPVGAFLSGGVDSGIVVALMARLSQSPVKTFTIGFEGDGLYDETAGARRVAAMYGTEHHEIRIRRQDMLDALPEVFGASAEPFADSSAIPTFLVARETRRHVKVALSGTAATSSSPATAPISPKTGGRATTWCRPCCGSRSSSP